MTVYVIGGDHYDAALGTKMLLSLGIAALPLGISEGPEHYDEQLNKGVVLEDWIYEKMLSAPATVYLVFCNTLSFAVDWDELSKKRGVPILSLTRVYGEAVKGYDTIGVLSCFESTNRDIRKFLDKEVPEVSTLSYAMCALVRAVEEQDPIVAEILEELVATSTKMGAKAFVMGCTHFEDYEVAGSTIDIVYPGKRLIEYAVKNGYITKQQMLAGE